MPKLVSPVGVECSNAGIAVGYLARLGDCAVVDRLPNPVAAANQVESRANLAVAAIAGIVAANGRVLS